MFSISMPFHMECRFQFLNVPIKIAPWVMQMVHECLGTYPLAQRKTTLGKRSSPYNRVPRGHRSSSSPCCSSNLQKGNKRCNKASSGVVCLHSRTGAHVDFSPRSCLWNQHMYCLGYLLCFVNWSLVRHWLSFVCCETKTLPSKLVTKTNPRFRQLNDVAQFNY